MGERGRVRRRADRWVGRCLVGGPYFWIVRSCEQTSKILTLLAKLMRHKFRPVDATLESNSGQLATDELRERQGRRDNKLGHQRFIIGAMGHLSHDGSF